MIEDSTNNSLQHEMDIFYFLILLWNQLPETVASAASIEDLHQRSWNQHHHIITASYCLMLFLSYIFLFSINLSPPLFLSLSLSLSLFQTIRQQCIGSNLINAVLDDDIAAAADDDDSSIINKLYKVPSFYRLQMNWWTTQR